MESGGTGPDTIMSNQEEVTEAAGYRYTGGGLGGKDLPSTDTSRSRTVKVNFDRWLGPVDTPLELWVGFMGREYSVKIPLDTVVDSAHLETDQEFLFNPITDQRAILTEVTLTPTQLCYEIETVGKMKQETGWDAMNGRFVLKMKDGSLITSEQLDIIGDTHYDWENNRFSFQEKIESVEFSDVGEVESIDLRGHRCSPWTARSLPWRRRTSASTHFMFRNTDMDGFIPMWRPCAAAWERSTPGTRIPRPPPPPTGM